MTALVAAFPAAPPAVFGEMSLEQLGAQAYAHYKAAEKANQKAHDHAMSAGKYLAEAKRRIDEETPYGERTRAWLGFLAAHCPLKRTRAEQLVKIAGASSLRKTWRSVAAPDRPDKGKLVGRLRLSSPTTKLRLPPPPPKTPFGPLSWPASPMLAEDMPRSSYARERSRVFALSEEAE